MTKTIIIAGIVLLALLAVGGIAWAKRSAVCGFGGAEGVAARVAHKLELDAVQKERLDGLVRRLGGLRQQWRETRSERLTELKGLLEGPALDRDRAVALLESRHQVWRARGPELVGAFADFTDSLNAAQRERLTALIEHRWGHRWHGGGDAAPADQH